jgi:hypothetical protein
MPYSIEGGCLCGAIRYRLTAPPTDVLHCHCDNCRKASGAAVLTWVTVAGDNFSWLQGEPRRYRYGSDFYPGLVERQFCGDCGSQLGWRCEDDGIVDITAGSLDDPNVVEPECHVFASGEIRWMHLDDGLPRHQSRVSDETGGDRRVS